MARPLFSNFAVTQLSASIGASDLTLTVESTQNFPVPTDEGDYFFIVVVGNCGNNNVEVMRVEAICGAQCLTVTERGAQGTTAQSFTTGDMVYGTMTAEDAQLIADRNQWYLGPFEEPPAVDNEGDDLQVGHLYYDTVVLQMRVWNGEIWAPFQPTVSGIIVEQFLFAPTVELPADTPIAFPDIYGNTSSDWEAVTHGVAVYKNGCRLIQEIDDLVYNGSYTVDFVTNQVTPLSPVEVGDTFEIVVFQRLDTVSLGDFIERTETDASAYGFVVDEDDLVSDSDQLLPTQQSVKAYADTKMKFGGTWAAGTYDPHTLVVDGEYAAVSLVTTTDKPAPQKNGNPAYGITGETFVDWVTTGNTVTVGNQYVTNTAGIIETLKIFGLDTGGSISSYQLGIFDVTGTSITLYQGASTVTITNDVVEFILPSIVVQSGRTIRVQVTFLGTNVAVPREVGFWTGTTNDPSWSSATEGYAIVDAVPDAGQTDNSFGVDVLFQPTFAISTEWALLPSGGGGGTAVGAGGGGGPTYYISDVAPSAGQGEDGDIWLVRE